MTASSRRGPIICVEGPSAAGKTSLAAALTHAAQAAVVEEVTGAPPGDAPPEAWFVARHADHWLRAVELARHAPFAVLDGDPFKGVWYNWVFADEPRASVAAATRAYQVEIERGRIGAPDLYVVLSATNGQLRARRAGDEGRTRRNFERHFRLVAPMRRYFDELATACPGRVLRLETSDRPALVGNVLEALARLPTDSPDPSSLLRHMSNWLEPRHS